jgi:hypothetical protein
MDFQGMRTRQHDRRTSVNFSTDHTAGEERKGEESARAVHRGDPPT